MAEPIGSAAGGHPDLNLSPEEKRVYGELLKEADPDGFGAVSGDVAVKFFERTKLPPDVLGQIWQIADTENRGFLTPAGFGVVLRLIGHSQAGRVPSVSLAPQPAPLPVFDGGKPRPAPAAPISAQPSGTPSSPTSTGPVPIRVPALAPEKVTEYSTLFEKSGAENGALSGTVAKQIFERARLPNEVLGRIWNLADTQGRGWLDATEFTIAMHLLASYKSGAMRGVPNTLPPGLYDAAARRPPPRMAAASPRPGSATGFAPGIAPQFSGYGGRPQSPIVPQFSGYGARAQSPRQSVGAPLSAQSTGDGWAVTPADKARFDQIFATIDRQGLGYINGEQAVTFFTNARLPEETLASIWDLADINSEGRLNRDEFAVAMYLIRQQRGTKDGRGNLPNSLPQALVPPSMRKQVHPPSQPTAPVFENAPITQPRSAAEDLFGLDVLSPAPAASAPAPAPATTAQASQSPRGADMGIFGMPASPTVQPTAPAASSVFKPFQPSSSFGMGIMPGTTGSPAPNQSRAMPAQNNNEDLLGDGDANVSSKLTNETAELGNMSNQIGTLSRETTDLQGKRTQAEQELSSNAQQKQMFESRLTQLRSAFDKEVKEFKALQEQLTTSRNESKRLQQDIAMIEGSHADTRRQHEQLRSSSQADQQENASLKEKIRLINVENDQLKPQIEKLKSDARQQKGLVAINKKQLATNELERDRIQTEIKTAQQELEEAKREIVETNRQIEVSKKEIEDSRQGVAATRKEIEEAHQKVAAARKELEETQQKAAAARKELEETRALPMPTMPAAPTQLPAPSSTAIPVAIPATTAETSRGLNSAGPPLASPGSSMISNPFMRSSNAFFSPPIGSPEPAHDHSAFDSIFGPSFGGVTTVAPETSFQSQTPTNQVVSHEVTSPHDINTPTSSTAPDIIEPPAPPSAKQITSDALPFRKPLERSESMTSSVKVVPPASRLSPVDTPRALTPGVSTPGTDKESSDMFAAAADEEQRSIRQTLPRGDTDVRTADIPGAFPSGTPLSESPAPKVNPTTIAVGAGAAVVAAGAGLAAAVTGQTHEKKEAKPESPIADTTASKANNFDEYFGGPAHQRTPSEQVKDFDDAFADMSTGPAKTNGATKAAVPEFPAIKEFDDDDDDSSNYSEETPLGFDDDFNTRPSVAATGTGTAASVVPPISSTAAGKQPEVASALPGYLQTRPALESVHSNASSLPGIDSQTSPPTYGDSVSDDNPSQFPREYKGLLPQREDPTSPPPTAGGSTHPGVNPSGSPPTYGPEAARTQEEAIEKTRASSMSQPPPAFDFDSAFAGMGPAQVHDDSDDEEVTFGSRAHQVPEFDPNFASPAQSRAPTVASVTQSPMTTYNAVTMHDAVTNGGAPNPRASSNSFFGVNSSVVTTPPAQTTADNAAAVSHDWDALFAPLSTGPAPDTGSLGRSVETQRTEISPEISAQTTAAEVSGTATPVPTATKSTAPIPQSFLKVDRPPIGRALSTGTEHDDPILKRLTAMGWSRTDSLAALEKFDYNIDKAADYLTFKS